MPAAANTIVFLSSPFTRLTDRWRVSAVVALVALVLGVCTFYHWRAPNPIQLARLDASVARIQELERDILSDVSFMRVGDRRSTRIREHLDQLGRTVLELKRAMELDFSGVVSESEGLFTSLYAQTETQERAVTSLVLHLEFMLERLYRIPETINAVERMAPYIWADPELTSVVGSILRDLFVSAARTDASADHWFEEDLERLRNLRDLAATDLAPVIERIAAYCEALTERTRFVDTCLRELEALPVGQAVSELREACLVDFARRHELARQWRWTLALVLGLTIMALSFRILVLGKSRQLDQTEAGLLKAQLGARDDLVGELELRLSDERIRAERAEASHRRSRRQEQAALRAKQESLSFLEHHVRGRARKLLAEVGEGDAPGGSRLAVSRHAQILHDTLSDMFDLQQVQANELRSERSECGLDDILARVEEHGRTLARTKAISLSIDRAEGTPSEIYTDPDRLRRLLQNLLEHAILSTDAGEVELSVDLSAEKPAILRFQVRDSGRGMNSDRIDFLFTPPQDGERIEGRAEASATPGLAIVPGLVKALGGSFHVDSIVGRGTTITLDVSISRPEEALSSVGESAAEDHGTMAVEPARTKPAPASTQPLSGRRILVAEDGADNRRLMEFLLTRAGADVDMAVNGEMACEDVMRAEELSEPYDLILMDMNMPVMDGYDATESLRTDGYERPIIALTASALPENRDRCLEAGCDEFMTKPVDAKVFAHQLEEIARTRVGPKMSPPTDSESGASSVPPDSETTQPSRSEVRSEGSAESQPTQEAPLLSEYADDDDMTELIELFVRDLKSDIRRINVAMSDGDLESLGVLAHQLKGSAGSYGFPQLTVQADRLESCVRTGVDPDRLEQEVRDFVGLCKRISG